MTQSANFNHGNFANRKPVEVNPDMLILAREARGLTQAQLAEACGITQGNISKYESQFLKISEDHIEKIAYCLQYPKGFFYLDEQRYGFGSSCTYHRRRQTMPVKELNIVLARTNIFRIRIGILLLGAEIAAENRFPRLDIAEYDGKVETVANVLRETWRLPNGPIRSLVRVIEQAGGIVFRCSFGTRKLDAISQAVPGLPPIFFVNSDIPGDRARFTLAHELGHIIMHGISTDHKEEEADRFASEFLLPSREIAPDLVNLNLPKLARLKMFWKSSMGSLIIKARDLDKITERQYRALYEQLGKSGLKYAEPDTVPIEEPTLVKELLRVHQQDHGYTLDELSQLLFIDEDEMREEFNLEKRQLRIVS